MPTNKKVKNRYALVIGNEDYQSKQRGLSDEQNVDYAVKDASIFQEYALKTLGVKEENMYFMTDATSGEMSQTIDLLSKILYKLGKKSELIVYYAGHGHPDELTKVPYLIPVDVSATNLRSAIKLSEMYDKLSSTGAKKVTVFLDACFTGGGRTSGLVASRGVKVKPKEGS
ncbi:caspase family protein [Flavobacteriales bacterium]|nr:caspase family protein [Flavobacteriales bacterium]